VLVAGVVVCERDWMDGNSDAADPFLGSVGGKEVHLSGSGRERCLRILRNSVVDLKSSSITKRLDFREPY